MNAVRFRLIYGCFYDWLSFVWIWVYFRFSVWFDRQTFVCLTPNRSEDCERRQFLLKSQLVLYSLALWFKWCCLDCLSQTFINYSDFDIRVIANTFLVRFQRHCCSVILSLYDSVCVSQVARIFQSTTRKFGSVLVQLEDRELFLILFLLKFIKSRWLWLALCVFNFPMGLELEVSSVCFRTSLRILTSRSGHFSFP